MYRADRHGGYRLAHQIGYRVDPGNRIAEVASYGEARLLVLEASFNADTGNTLVPHRPPALSLVLKPHPLGVGPAASASVKIPAFWLEGCRDSLCPQPPQILVDYSETQT